MRLHMPFNPPHVLLPKSSFVCTHLVITHPGHKTYRILNWTEVSNALKEFMLHNCTGLPENKQWCMAKIFSQGDDSDPCLWLRPYLAADGATCNLSSRCGVREGKQERNEWSRGCKMRKHKVCGAFGDPQHVHSFRIKATLELRTRKPIPISMTQQPICGWRSVAGSALVVQAAMCLVAPTTGQPADSTGHSCTSGVRRSGVGGFPIPGCPAVIGLPKAPQLLLGPMNGQDWVFCGWRKLWVSPLCLDTSLPRTMQMILLLHLYHRSVFATELAVCEGFAVTALTLNMFLFFVFCNHVLYPKDIIWLLIIKLIFQPRLTKIHENFTLQMWHSTSA